MRDGVLGHDVEEGPAHGDLPDPVSLLVVARGPVQEADVVLFTAEDTHHGAAPRGVRPQRAVAPGYSSGGCGDTG